MRNIAGRLSWRNLLLSQLPILVALVAAVAATVSSLHNHPRDFIVPGFTLLTGSAALAWFALSWANVVASFEFDGQRLTYALVGRRRRTVPRSDVLAVNAPQPSNRRRFHRRGAQLQLGDGRSLFLSFDHLESAELLADALRAASGPAPKDDVQGNLDRVAVAALLVGHSLIACLLLAVAAFAAMILGAALRNPRDVPNPLVFHALGGLLLALCAAGFYFGVLRHWIGCVRWFRLSQGVFSYRTVLSRTVRQRLWDDLELVAAPRPGASRAMGKSYRTLRFRDGEQIQLHFAELTNAAALIDRLTSEGLRRWRNRDRPALATIPANDPRCAALQPYLEKGELVSWVGRPVYARLWSEMSAEVIFGLLPGAAGVGALIMAPLAVKQGDVWGSLFSLVVGLGFLGIGLRCMAAPWRYWRMLPDVVYAVTTRRAIIVNALAWGRQAAVQRADPALQSYWPYEVRDYEIMGRGRDVALGGQWRRGRKGSSHWVHFGFLAPDDPRGAEAALQGLAAASA